MEYLEIKPSVRLTPRIQKGIDAIRPFFNKHKVKAFVTSGERTSEDQLEIIRSYAIRYGVDKEFPIILKCKVNDIVMADGVKFYAWQKPWSRLLSKGVIINPPKPAKCLFDYIRDGVNKKGQVIGKSPHWGGKDESGNIIEGRAFDIGGGIDHDISNELVVIQDAFKNKVSGLKSFLPERNNNAIHIDCE